MRLKLRTLKKICITELIDHVISQSKALYAGTEFADSFYIFHDGLTAWWEPSAQAYIASLGFQDRQLRCIDPTNADNRYKGKPVGDSPELCRALDSFGFAYLQSSVRLHSAITSLLPKDHPKRFNMGTPAQVESTLRRCWTVAPTSEQIITDIQGLPRVLEKIILAKGCVVGDEFLRRGRRERRADEKGVLTSRLRGRQRVSTNTDLVLHDDCAPALAALDAASRDALEELVEVEADDEYDRASECPDAFPEGEEELEEVVV